MTEDDDTFRPGSPAREVGGEPESCFRFGEESAAESSSPEGSLDRPHKQARRHSLHEEAVKAAVTMLTVACHVPVGTHSKKATVEDVVVDGFLQVACRFPGAFAPWLSPKAQGLIDSTPEALGGTASTAEGQGSRPRSARLRSKNGGKNGGFKKPAPPGNKPVPDRVAEAINNAFVGQPGKPVPLVHSACIAVRFGKDAQGGQASAVTSLISPGDLILLSYNEAVDGDKHKAKAPPAAQQEGLAIVVSAPLFGGGPKSPLTVNVLWVWRKKELLAHGKSRGVHVTCAGEDFVQLRPTQASSRSDVESIIEAVFKPPSKNIEVVVLSDLLDQVPVASVLQVMGKPARRSLIPEVVGGAVGDEERRFVYSHECTFQP